MNEGRSSEALPLLQAASKLPAPKTLVAYTHLLSGSCLAHMVHFHIITTKKKKKSCRIVFNPLNVYVFVFRTALRWHCIATKRP